MNFTSKNPILYGRPEFTTGNFPVWCFKHQKINKPSLHNKSNPQPKRSKSTRKKQRKRMGFRQVWWSCGHTVPVRTRTDWQFHINCLGTPKNGWGFLWAAKFGSDQKLSSFSLLPGYVGIVASHYQDTFLNDQKTCEIMKNPQESWVLWKLPPPESLMIKPLTEFFPGGGGGLGEVFLLGFPGRTQMDS